MAYISQYQYYENGGVQPEDANWGSYQYVSLQDIVNNFLLMYSGTHSLVNNEERYKVLFHAKRAIQELNYDAFKEIKVLELALSPQYSEIDYDRLTHIKKSIYLNQGNQFNGQLGWNYDGMWYFEANIGTAYGLNTETANFNPTFNVDRKSGVINFDSSMSGQQCILEYVSDGMEGGDNSLITVNKLFEKYIYASIQYDILSSKLGVQEYIVARARKEKSALLRNAKIRISNIHPGRLLMNLRGLDKQIK